MVGKLRTKEAFKVVIFYGNSRSYKSTDFSIYSLIYAVGETTKPTMGKIFCFDTLVNAEKFVGLHIDQYPAIFKGIAVNPFKAKYICGFIPSIPLFWETYEKAKKKHRRFPVENLRSLVIKKPFEGTLFCDSFTPTEIVRKY